jgi:glycine hydroxymethyltransferase
MSIIFDLIEKEKERQATTIELIASENFVSDNVLKALGSCLTNKYSEGYPNYERSGNRGRYYGGCQYVDMIEQECCDLWKQVFTTNYHVNVQPHSGSQANYAAYAAILKPGDTILAMNLENGGHLTHGSSVNFSGKLYNMVFYGVDSNGYIDYIDLCDKIVTYKPKVIVAGASAYPREIDFAKIRNIIDAAMYEIDGEYNPYFMVDMAHIAGLIAAGVHQSPFGLADIITTTTHKTLRGPRGGLIFCKPYLAKKIDSAVFPGSQGGPLQNVIAAKAIAAEECLTPEYGRYIRDVKYNCKFMADVFISRGFDVVTGGTDNHLFLVDLSRTHPAVSGHDVQEELDKIGITLNKNCVPGEKRSPKEASGIRIGTAAMTTRGFLPEEFANIAHTICEVINTIQEKKSK